MDNVRSVSLILIVNRPTETSRSGSVRIIISMASCSLETGVSAYDSCDCKIATV